MRRGSLFQLLVIGVLIGGAVSAVALLIPWLPPSASDERGRIDVVFWLVTAICIAIFAIVFAVIDLLVPAASALVPTTIPTARRFMGIPGSRSRGRPCPTVLVVVIAVVSAVALAKNDSIPADQMTVDVTAQQFAWSFKYPRRGGRDLGRAHGSR